MLNQKIHRVELLDVVRGLAATMVVIHHVLRATPGLNSVDFWDSGALPWWVRWIFLGDFAVTLFFVLSGVSLALSQISKESSIVLGPFYVKRFFRVYPLFFCALIVYYLFRPIYASVSIPGQSDWLSPQFVKPITLETWLTYLSMTFNVFNMNGYFNNVMWSLPIEMQFYLFFPALYFMLNIESKFIGVLLMSTFCCFAMIASHYGSLPGQTLGRLWEFGGGLVVGCHARAISVALHRRYSKVLLSAIVIICFFLDRIDVGVPISLWPSNAFGVFASFGIAIMAVANSEWRPRKLFDKLLVRIGILSYGIYIWHMIPLALFSPILIERSLHGVYFVILSFLIAYSVSILISHAVYNMLELPAIRFGNKISVKMRN